MSDKNPSPLGRRVIRSRKALGLSARRMSQLATLPESYVGHLESGAIQSPGVDQIKKLLGLLDCDANWLLTGRGNAPACLRGDESNDAV